MDEISYNIQIPASQGSEEGKTNLSSSSSVLDPNDPSFSSSYLQPSSPLKALSHSTQTEDLSKTFIEQHHLLSSCSVLRDKPNNALKRSKSESLSAEKTRLKKRISRFKELRNRSASRKSLSSSSKAATFYPSPQLMDSTNGAAHDKILDDIVKNNTTSTKRKLLIRTGHAQKAKKKTKVIEIHSIHLNGFVLF